MKKAAKELAAFLAFRAEQEGVSCELDAEWFLKQMETAGFAISFFGIEYNAGGITENFQRPDLLERWRSCDRALASGADARPGQRTRGNAA
jgi:hypothetical protein